MGADKVKKTDVTKKKKDTLGARSCPVLHAALKGLSGTHWACAERWWTGPGLLLLLSLPVSASPPPVLPTNHNWQGTHRTLSTPMDRKSRADLSQSEGMNTGKERIEGVIKPVRFQEHQPHGPAKCAASLFWRLQNFHKLMKDVELQKQDYDMTEHHLLEHSVFIYVLWEDQMFKSIRVKYTV